MRRASLAVAIFVAAGGLAAGGSARAAELTSDQAVAVALQRNRDAIAARLEIEASELDVVAARIYPNPVFEYSLGNLVLGTANSQQTPPPGFFGQPVQTVGVTEIVDIWMKRSARIRAAEKGTEHRRLLTEDALREIVYTVRSGFADTVREQEERQLAHDVADRYAQTIKISQARFKAGDISEAELRKIELEGLRYQNDVIEADMELDVARGKLAALLGLPSVAQLPTLHPDPSDAASRPAFELGRLTQRALERRPDLRAAGAARVQADAQLASAERDALPDITLGAGYTHSDFTVSGDNPNTLGLTLSLPLPLFDRNQANIGRARLDQRRADNDGERLRIAVARDVAEAVRKGTKATTLLAVFERPAGGDVPGTPTGTGDKGGMISRAETALRVAEKSYRAGAISLIELLEAQRTYLDTEAQYLRALYDFRQATVDVSHAVGEP
ncbi:MAG TPA: TolC family protein [Polyangia bacterium]|jgi:cobalt-zinc-cadmium efflux system outer membrane protein